MYLFLEFGSARDKVSVLSLFPIRMVLYHFNRYLLGLVSRTYVLITAQKNL